PLRLLRRFPPALATRRANRAWGWIFPLGAAPPGRDSLVLSSRRRARFALCAQRVRLLSFGLSAGWRTGREGTKSHLDPIIRWRTPRVRTSPVPDWPANPDVVRCSGPGAPNAAA